MSTNSAMVLALAAAVMGGCAGGTQEGSPSPEPDPWVLEVQNNNWQDATVYAVTDGTRHRVGTVVTSQSERFTLPEGAVRAGEVRLLVRLIGSSKKYVSPPIMLSRGDVITFDVENHLPMSSYLVLAEGR